MAYIALRYEIQMQNKTLRELGIDSEYQDEPNGMFDSLFDIAEECLECGYEGPLTLRKRGYQCPECQTLILPME